jgi:D-alanine-D-alanine ligase
VSSLPRVLILSGGISHERDISLKSGRKVADGLISHGMSVELRDPDGTLIEHLREHPPEVVWPVLHGASGEDGALRALLEMLGIPYVGSSADASRIAWNKPVAKSLVERSGVATPPSITLSRDAFRELGAESVLETVTSALELPLIVKPAQGGSAQGVSWVDSSEDLRKAMVHAFTYSDIALIEKRIIGAEVCVPIIDTGDGPRAIQSVEIEPLSGHYDFEARYTAGATRFYTPPRLEPEVMESLNSLALESFSALGLRHLARVDFIVDSAGKPWFLEASTMPGLTETSSTALALDSAGYDVGGVYGALVDAALAKP